LQPEARFRATLRFPQNPPVRIVYTVASSMRIA
jgi:hypothetical protein